MYIRCLVFLTALSEIRAHLLLFKLIMSASGFNKKADTILVSSNIRKHTTGATSGTGTVYLSAASEFLVEFVLLNL